MGVGQEWSQALDELRRLGELVWVEVDKEEHVFANLLEVRRRSLGHQVAQFVEHVGTLRHPKDSDRPVEDRVGGAQEALVGVDFAGLCKDDGLERELEVIRVEALLENRPLGLLDGSLLSDANGLHAFYRPEGIANDLAEARRLKWFLEHAKNFTPIDGFDDDWKVGPAGHQNADAPGLDLSQTGKRPETVLSGHIVVDKGQIEGRVSRVAKGFCAIASSDDLMSFRPKDTGDGPANQGFIIYDKNACQTISCSIIRLQK